MADVSFARVRRKDPHRAMFDRVLRQHPLGLGVASFGQACFTPGNLERIEGFADYDEGELLCEASSEACSCTSCVLGELM